ncbi:MarR family transcriptional regulator [Nocardia sp. ET3-3]|uniref:MarR family transcriptional regulator n=1 Tax=Nocardia terrae TaxID=2675851 RepID=A0A7K1VCY9_9NOCA|nr:MarR family transcriptional regulator [Nocardia terrae]MVU83998.1 MarR family transcriptional regulator [Nocardia terrae]
MSSRWLTPAQQEAWLAYLSASSLLERRIGRQLERDSGLSHLQYEILVRLAAAPDGELRMAELATTLLNSKSKLTYQVDQLEKAGLVTRRSCHSDLRAVYARLTDAGRERLEQAAPGHVDTVREFFIDAFTPEQLAAVTTGFTEANRRLRDAPG